METAKYLLVKILILIPIILAFAFLYKMGTMLVPYLPKTMKMGSSGEDFLPPPGSLSLAGKAKTPDANTNVYVHGNTFNGYGTSSVDTGNNPQVYVSYDEKGNIIYKDINGNVVDKSAVEYNANTTTNNQPVQAFNINDSKYERALYVRNLSIFQNGHIYTGLRFSGEAKGTMFNNGTFPIFIVDSAGRVIAKEQAVATEKWAVPGWVRFNVKINSILPMRIPCFFVFQAENGSPESRKGVFVTVPETCN